jgi:hypothetical protein
MINAQAQNQLGPTLAGTFEIPAQNGKIVFSTDGTFQGARLENDAWEFVNLKFRDFPQQEKLNLTITAQNSNVTITSYRSVRSNTTLGNIRIRYTVVGQGKQTFNFGDIPQSGFWSAVFDGVYPGQEDRWSVSAQGTVTVTGAASHSNVSIIYYTYPDSFVALSEKPFFERNSVAIATAIALTATVVLAVAVWTWKERKESSQSGLQ